MAIRFVFIDIDDTLIDFSACARHSLEQAVCRQGWEWSEETFSRFQEVNHRYWSDHEKGLISQDDLRVERFCALFSLSRKDATQFEGCFQEGLATSAFLMEGAKECAEYLSAKYPFFAATNAVAATQRNRMALAGLTPYFTDLFISGDLGASKPSKAFFDAAFARIPHLNPADGIIIGDSLTSDIAGGQAAGMQTCWFNPKGRALPEGYRCDLQLSHLSQISQIL